MEEHNNMAEKIYSQDCEFYRYQDQLRWSRFKTASIVEGFVFTGIYKLSLPLPDLKIFMIIGFFLVLILLLLSWKDMLDAKFHMYRIRKYEEKHLNSTPKKSCRIFKGEHLMISAIFVINILNIYILVIKW